MRFLLVAITANTAAAFQHAPCPRTPSLFRATATDEDNPHSSKRRSLMLMAGGGFFSGFFGKEDNFVANAYTGGNVNAGKGPTNEVVKTVNGMRRRRLGGSDIVVSELGLGTQRW